jgi:hypothetical protein
VILKSGKRIEGQFLGEDSSTLQLKDAGGIVLSFKKTILDESATDAANAAPVKNDFKNSTLVHKTSKRIYTNDDISKMPELSVIQGDGYESSNAEVEALDTPLTRADPKEERSWRGRAASLKKELARLRERRIQAEASCEKSRQNASNHLASPQKKPVNLLSIFEQSSACKMLDEIDRQILDAEERWDDFETEARRAEVPWQWLD